MFSDRISILPPICGVYRLYLENEVVYVGKSTDIDFRIREHVKCKDKIFDSYDYILANGSEMDDLESDLVLAHSPLHNLKFPHESKKYISLNIAKRMCDLDIRNIRKWCIANDVEIFYFKGQEICTSKDLRKIFQGCINEH